MWRRPGFVQCAAVGLTIISSVEAMKVCLALLYRLHECKETLFSEPGCHMVSAVQQELTEVQLALNYVFCKALPKVMQLTCHAVLVILYTVMHD